MVVALNATARLVPEEVKLLNEGESTTLIIGLDAVPPVDILVPGCTYVVPIVPSGAKMEYKLVLPENKVPPLIVLALNTTARPVPEIVMLLTDGLSTRLIIGLDAVPPVDILAPGCTYVVPIVPSGAKMEYKLVLPENKVPPLRVVAEKLRARAEMPEPDNKSPLNEGLSTTLNIGAEAVPPVWILP